MVIDERLPTRFTAKIAVMESGCWEWTGYRTAKGYGLFAWGGGKRNHCAHRLAYEWLVGEIPKGLQLDHLCRNRSCVNPAHLEPVTCKENLRRGRNFESEKTHCPRGHPYDEANTYVNPNKGGRDCRACAKAARERYRQGRKLMGHANVSTTAGYAAHSPDAALNAVLGLA